MPTFTLDTPLSEHGQPRVGPAASFGSLALLTGLTVLTPLAAQAAPQVFQVTNEAGQAVPNVAVSVLVKGAKASAPASTTAELGQRNKAFTPNLLVIQTGTQVSFPNFDTVRHHVYSFSPAHPFEIKLYAGTPAAPVLFDKAGTATLGCNIHDRMLAYIHVVDTPYFGVTDATGKVTIDLPAGDHLARLWTPNLGEKSPGNEHPVKAGGAPLVIRTKL
jgi:plastocyanin